jgi:protein SCO1/2
VERPRYVRSEHPYKIPNFTLLNQDGEETPLDSVFESDKPVMVNFMFVTCTTICPVMSAVFAQAQRKLGPEAEEVHMVSFTIDPDYDTPEKLKGYAKLYRAGPQWQFFTGTRDQIHQVQKAFDAYSQNKMSHLPLTFLRASGGAPWVRIDGITSASALLAEYQKLRE